MKKVTKQGLRTILVALALAGSLMTASAWADSTMTVATPQDPGSWDPVDTYLVNWAAVATNIYDGLTYRGPDAKLVPGLATSWQEKDGGKRIRFHLRQGVKFHDGEPFNAAAVKFTFDRLLGEEGAKGPQKSNYAAIDRVEVIDDNTVDFHLKQNDPVLYTKLAGYGAMIVPPKYIKDHGEAYFNTHPVGTGPYRFVSYQPKIGIKLRKFDGFWGDTAKIDHLNYRFIAEPSTAVFELQAGGVDVVTSVPIDMIGTIKKDPNLAIVAAPGPTVYALRFNTKKGITKDVRVRKALIYAVDRQAIIDQILGGQAEPIASFQGKLSFGYDPNMAPLPFDPIKAKELLRDAGVKPGAKVQIDIRGNKTTFNEVAQAVAGYLRGVGINATIKPYESNFFLNDIVPQGKTGAMFQQGWGGWTFDYDNTAYFMYHSGEKWNPYDSDPRLDRLLESQRAITDRVKRQKILRHIAQYVADRALEMPLYNVNAIFAVSRRIQNFTPAPDNRLRLNEVTLD